MRTFSRFAVVLVLCCSTQHTLACVFCEMICSNVHGDSADASYANTDEVSPSFTNNGQLPQPGGDGTPVTVTYSYNNFLDGGIKNLAGESYTPEFLRQATEEAFGVWAAVAPLHFVETPDIGSLPYRSNGTSIFPTTRGGSTVAPVPYNSISPDNFGKIRINHGFINGTDAENGRPTTKAQAWFPSSLDPIASDIMFDNGDPWEIMGTSSAPDVLGIMVHEIGHAIGLVHSAIDGTVMFPAALRRNGPGTAILRADDIARVQAVYGEGVGSVTPLTLVPEATAALLAAIGIGGLACRGRRRRTG